MRILAALGAQAPPHDSRRAVERRGAGPARLAGLREGALRHVRGSQAGVRQVWRLLQHRLGNGPRARRDRLRPSRRRATSCARPSRPSRTSGVLGVADTRAPAASRFRLHVASTSPACPASAWSRTRSSTATTPGTPTSIPTSGSSRRRREVGDGHRGARCTTWRCATTCCPASPRTRCRSAPRPPQNRGN